MTSEATVPTAPFATAEALLRASLAQGAKATEHDGHTKTYEFADPRFKDYFIRTHGFNEALQRTTYLTPVSHIFHGPNIGQPLVQGKAPPPLNGLAAPAEPRISIMLKQPGTSIGSLSVKETSKAVFDRIAANPKALKSLFQTVAFVGAFEKTFSRYQSGKKAIDLALNNIMLDTNGSLGLIDQMHDEDTASHSHSGLDLDKAKHSITYLHNEFTKNFFHPPNVRWRHFINTMEPAMDPAVRTLINARLEDTPNAQLAYLQKHLSPEGEHWLGVQPVVTPETTDETLKNPAFGGVTNVQATTIDIRKKGSAEQLLATLNEMKGACLDPRGR